MFHQFQARTADELWRQLHRALHTPKVREQAGRGGDTRELLHVTLCLEEPQQRWVTSRQPALNLAFALAEVIWIVTGREDAAFLTYFFPHLPEYMGEGPTFHGAYGHRLRHRFGVDQLDRAYHALRANPESRQVILQIWDPAADLPAPDGQPKAADIPCNLLSLLKVRDGQLEWTQVMRSNDLYRGLPHNVVQFTCLQEIMAGWLNLQIGAYHHISDSLHYYERNEQEFSLSVDAPFPVPNPDSLACNREESDRCLGELARQVERIINPAVGAATLAEELQRSVLPAAYLNIARVLIAEGVRRRQELILSEAIMQECTNPAYQQLQAKWLARVHQSRPERIQP